MEEYVVIVEDFNGYMVSVLNVLWELYFSKASLANGFFELILSQTCMSSH